MPSPARSGSMLLLCLGILTLVAVVAFGFLRLVTRYQDTNGPSTRLLMAQQAALAGRSHAVAAILRDYGERGTFVRAGDPGNATPGKVAYPSRWTQADGVRVSCLDGGWRGTFLPGTRPGLSNVLGGAYPSDEVTADTRLDAPFTRVWGAIAADSLGTFDVQPFEAGFANTTGRGRFFEIENYEQDAAVRLANVAGVPPTDNGITQRFSDLATIPAAAPGIRGEAGYYDEQWRDVTRDGMAVVDARRVARYRLRYAVMVEELDSHIPINATGRDHPLGNEIRETDPDAVTVGSPYDAHDTAALTRRTVRYSPSIFNLGYASQPWNFGDGPMPLFFGAMIEHMFQGRGMAANVDRDAQGFPTSWPLMYRRGNLDGQEPDSTNDPVPNPGGYNVFSKGNQEKWSVQTQYLYTDGIASIQQYKYGGKPVKTVGAWYGTMGHILWHALTGRQVSFTNLWSGIGMCTRVGLHPYRAWAMYFLTPFNRGLELRDPATPRDPTLRWQADTDTPMHVNLLTATPITIHAMTLAYLPPTAKALRISSVEYQNADPAKSCTLEYNNPNMPMQFNIPSRDLFVPELWRNGGATPFAYTAPARSAADGIVAPDWYHSDWSARRGNQHYPGGVLSGDLPPVADCASDDTGLLIRTDNVHWDATKNNDALAPEWGMRDQGVDTLAGRTFIVLPANYTVTAPSLPPGWGAPPEAVTAGGAPIQNRITEAEWTATAATGPQNWTDANGNNHATAPGSTPTWSAKITYAGSQSGGALAGYGRTWWCDVMVAFHSSITVARAQWTQRDGHAFDPYWSNPGNQVAVSPTGNQEFRKTWDPRRVSTLADYDRIFLAQLGIDLSAPTSSRVAPGWNIGVQRKRRGMYGARIEPAICIEEGTWNAGHNLRTLAGNTASDDAGTVGTPKWQRAQEAGGNWTLLYPATPPDPSVYSPGWNRDAAKVAAFVAAYQANYGLVFATSANGTVFSSRLRTAAMEMVLNDWRYSFLGSSPAYAADFRPLDFNGDGLVNCSVYPVNPTALQQERLYHLDHFVDADGAGRGRSIDPRSSDTPFCIAGNFFLGKSRFYRVLTRGEVWDNVLGRIAAAANLDSAMCVDSADRDRPDDLSTGHLLYQRWFFDPQRPAQVQGR